MHTMLKECAVHGVTHWESLMAKLEQTTKQASFENQKVTIEEVEGFLQRALGLYETFQVLHLRILSSLFSSS